MHLRQIAATAILVALATFPFLNKPVHIDDTFVLHVTRSLIEQPLNPFLGQIDWFGHLTPVWEATTNPPFLSYYLGPSAAFSNFDEIALHLAMVPFYLLLVVSLIGLCRRFLSSWLLPVSFVMLSPAVIVSGNLMRDVPGAALATAAVAAYVRGVDERRMAYLAIGPLLAGLAMLTKYSAAIVLPVLLLYALFQNRLRDVIWLLIPAFMLFIWCLHNWWIYGIPHIVYLLLERRSVSGLVWQGKLLGGLTILGSALFLVPGLILQSIRSRNWTPVLWSFPAILFSLLFTLLFYRDRIDLEYFFWVAMGVTLLVYSTRAVFSKGQVSRDSLFLFLWLMAPLVFSVILVPFQAVRHLLPALPPLMLLLFRYLERVGNRGFVPRITLICLLLFQASTAYLVQIADYQYAESYRDFSVRARERWVGENYETWYVGHWGWKFYADQSGFRQLHRDGPHPAAGDLLIWPERVHIGDVFEVKQGLRDRLDEVERRRYNGSLPIHTMSSAAGAGFYSVVRQRLPYRLFSDEPLEVMRVFEVTSQEE